MQKGWDNKVPSDVVQDIKDACEALGNQVWKDPWEGMIFPVHMTQEIESIMIEQGFTSLSQVFSYLAAKIVKEEGLDRYIEIMTYAYNGMPMPENKAKGDV